MPELVTHDKAGERILEGLLVVDAEQRLHEEGIRGTIYLFKNNTDSAGNSYGCHENYLTSRRDDFGALRRGAHPVPGQPPDLVAGAGKVLQTARGAMFSISQRAEHIWEGVSAPRPVPPDHQHPRRAARRRRALPPAARHRRRQQHERDTPPCSRSGPPPVLRMLEEPGVVMRDMTLENPIRAIREISHDITCSRKVRLANGREVSALDIQSEYLERALRFAETAWPVDPGRTRWRSSLWEHCRSPPSSDDRWLDRPGDRLGHQAQPDRALPGHARPGTGSPSRPARSRLPRHQPRPRPVLPAAGQRASSSG
jgi:proteasome accessory factor A